MLTFIAQNIWTIIIIAVLILVVFLIIRSMVKNKKAGKSSCSCGCDSCPMSGSCHTENPKQP